MIAADKFVEKFELLPGEEKIWEGGSSVKGLFSSLLHALLAVAVFMLIFTVFTGSSRFYLTDNPDYKEPPASSSEQVLNGSGDVEAPAATNDAQARKLFDAKRFAIYWSLVMLFSVCFYVYAFRKMIDNYWLIVTTERISLRSGFLNRKIVTVDLDKVTSINTFHSPVDRFFGLHSLEVLHTGASDHRYPFAVLNPYCIRYVDISKNLSSTVIKAWLPRDNAHSRSAL